MDQKTFEELLKKGELDLILMDGGKNLTKDQMNRVRGIAKQQSKERLMEMAEQLANTPGYEDFMKMPLIGSIMAGKNKSAETKKEDTPQTQQEPKQNPQKKSEKKQKKTATPAKKDPNFATISSSVVSPLSKGDSAANILGKIYNFMNMDYDDYMKNMVEDKKYNEKLEKLKVDRNKELIDLFAGKKPEEKEIKKSRQQRRAEERKQKKEEEKQTKAENKKAQDKTKKAKQESAKQEPVKTAEKVKPVESPPTAQKAPELPSVKPSAQKLPFAGKALVGVAATLASGLAAAGISEKGQANILAQVQSESGFKTKSEDLTYKTPERIQQVFGKNRFPTVESAKPYVNNPEALANYVYAKTDGNSEQGDGWKYRGRGYLQHTGKNQYKEIAKYTGVDVVNNPDKLNDPEVASKAVAWFFLVYKKKKPEDLENIDVVNKAVGFSGGKEESLKRESISNQIGEKLKSSSVENKELKKQAAASSGTNVAVLNNTTNIVNGGTTYEDSGVNSNLAPAAVNKQYKI